MEDSWTRLTFLEKNSGACEITGTKKNNIKFAKTKDFQELLLIASHRR